MSVTSTTVPKSRRRAACCPNCGGRVIVAPDVTGELLERSCRVCGLVLGRPMPLHVEHVERFKRTPTNFVVFGGGLGNTAHQIVLHAITQRNKDVVAIEKGRIIEANNNFIMATAEGRKRMKAQQCQFKSMVAPSERDKNVKRALEIISRWNREQGKLWNKEDGFLDEAQLSHLSSRIIKSMRATTEKYGIVKRSRILLVINTLLRMYGYPPIPSNRKHRVAQPIQVGVPA